MAVNRYFVARENGRQIVIEKHHGHERFMDAEDELREKIKESPHRHFVLRLCREGVNTDSGAAVLDFGGYRDDLRRDCEAA